MTDPLEIPKGEHSVYRLFAIDLPSNQIAAFTTPIFNADNDTDYALRDALGVHYLDEQHVQIIALDDLKELRLSGYLTDGLGIAPDDFAADKDRLDALGGHIAVTATAAFEQPEHIAPNGPVSFIAAYKEDAPLQQFIDLSTTSAEGVVDARHNPLADAPIRIPRRSLLTLIISLSVIGYGIYALFAGQGASQ